MGLMKKMLAVLTACAVSATLFTAAPALAQSGSSGVPSVADSAGMGPAIIDGYLNPAPIPDNIPIEPHMQLRPDDTGMCEYDAVKWWVQACDVWSPAMNKMVRVQIRPARKGGNAGAYLLDGVSSVSWTSSWSASGRVMEVFENDNITLVMPVGGAAQFYTDWVENPERGGVAEIIKWETFLTAELPVYLQNHFGVSRNNNVLAGISMGGVSAMNIAAHHRDMFKHVTSLSGYYQMQNPETYTMLKAIMAPYGYSPDQMWGPPGAPARIANDPSANVPYLKGVPIYISAATGMTYPSEMLRYLPSDFINRTFLERASWNSTREFERYGKSQGLDITADYSTLGIHSWANWTQNMYTARPQILDAVNGW